MTSNQNEIVRRTARTVALVVATVAIATPSVAQQNVLGPPEALQYPFEAEAETASRGLNTFFLRGLIEQAADLALCQALMTNAGRPIPSPFVPAGCEPAFAERVRNGEGIVHWADGARPLQCGEDCVGPPLLTQTDFVTRANLRQVTWHGNLTFVADPPGPTNRDITYGYDVQLTCAAENGAQTGDFTVTVDVHEPVIGDPGFFESVFDFFASGNLSNFIENRISRELTSVGSISESFGRCLSIGVFRSTNAQDAFLNDGAIYDPAPAGSETGRPTGASGPVAATLSRDRATIHFLRIIRKRLPALGGAGQAPPGSPAMGQFDVFLNGLRVALPPLAPNVTGAIDLPPEGGTVELNYCKTIDVTDYDRLQLLFTNGLGGAVWSQFARADGFGVDAANRMTTGRVVVVPGQPGPPNPVTGQPTQTKPQSVTVREFELVYAITFAPRSDTIAPTLPASPGQATGPVRGRGRFGTPALENAPVVAVDPSAPTPRPCRQI